MNKAACLLASLCTNQHEQSERDILWAKVIDNWIKCEYTHAHKTLMLLLTDYSKDVLAIYAAHMLEFYMGWTSKMIQTVKLVLPVWKKTDSLYGYLRGIEAFSLEENGYYTEARMSVEEALRINSRDIYAVHAMCHIFYETGEYTQGIKWMDDRLFDWQDNLFMRIHIWWHYALFRLYLFDLDKVCQVYRNKIRKKNDLLGLEDLDAVSILWRLNLIGDNRIKDWKYLFNCWKNYIHDRLYWFNDLHAMFVLSANGEFEMAEDLKINSLSQYCVSVDDKSLRKIFEAIIAFAQNKYVSCYKQLESVLNSVVSLGGSKAQLDVLEMTAIEAAIRSGNEKEAKNILAYGRCFRFSSPLRSFYHLRLKSIKK